MCSLRSCSYSRAATSTSAGTKSRRSSGRRAAVAQEVMRREKLANEEELQGWFIRRIERFLRAHGRQTHRLGRDARGWARSGSNRHVLARDRRWHRGGATGPRRHHDADQPDVLRLLPGKSRVGTAGHRRLRSAGQCLRVRADPRGPHAPTGRPRDRRARQSVDGIHPDPDSSGIHAMPRMLALSEVLWSPKEARSWRGSWRGCPRSSRVWMP